MSIEAMNATNGPDRIRKSKKPPGDAGKMEITKMNISAIEAQDTKVYGYPEFSAVECGVAAQVLLLKNILHKCGVMCRELNIPKYPMCVAYYRTYPEMEFRVKDICIVANECERLLHNYAIYAGNDEVHAAITAQIPGLQEMYNMLKKS